MSDPLKWELRFSQICATINLHKSVGNRPKTKIFKGIDWGKLLSYRT